MQSCWEYEAEKRASIETIRLGLLEYLENFQEDKKRRASDYRRLSGRIRNRCSRHNNRLRTNRSSNLGQSSSSNLAYLRKLFRLRIKKGKYEISK